MHGRTEKRIAAARPETHREDMLFAALRYLQSPLTDADDMGPFDTSAINRCSFHNEE